MAARCAGSRPIVTPGTPPGTLLARLRNALGTPRLDSGRMRWPHTRWTASRGGCISRSDRAPVRARANLHAGLRGRRGCRLVWVGEHELRAKRLHVRVQDVEERVLG